MNNLITLIHDRLAISIWAYKKHHKHTAMLSHSFAQISQPSAAGKQEKIYRPQYSPVNQL